MSIFKKTNFKKTEIDIEDYYALKISALWRGFKQEHFSFWALCAYFFFEYVRPQSIYPSIDIIPWAQITLLLTLVSVFMDSSVKWVSNIENKLTITLLIVIIMSGIFAFDPSVSWDHWVFFLNWFLVYFLVINIVNTEKRLFVFILLFLLFSFKMAQNGAVTWALRGFSFTDWGLVGAAGWFRNSGEFSIQMLIFVSLSIAFIVAIKEKWGPYKKYFFYLMPITGFLSIIGSSSRGAQLALVVIGLFLLLKWKQRTRAIIILSLVILALFVLLPDEQVQRFVDVEDDINYLQRVAYWEYGLRLMNEYPVLGIGYYNWLDYVAYKVPEGLGPRGMGELPHNIFIQIGAEAGYIGLLIFLSMVFFLFRLNASTRAAAKVCKNDFLYFLSYGLDAGCLGYLVAGFFVTVFYYPFFWVQMALSVAVYSIAKKCS